MRGAVTVGDGDGVLGVLGARLAADDPVPASVATAGRGAFAFRTLDSDYAELVYDSAIEGRSPVGVRAGDRPGATRQLTFGVAERLVEIQVVSETARSETLVGQLVPPVAARVHVHHRGGTECVDADQLGRFTAREICPGPLSVRFDVDGRAPVVTAWVVA